MEGIMRFLAIKLCIDADLISISSELEPEVYRPKCRELLQHDWLRSFFAFISN